jgi:cyclohexa-1,5-dienecarbonyl-CoA hydratase
MACVHVTVAGGLARVELDRPPLNVVDLRSAPEIAEAIEGVSGRSDAAVIVLSGRGRAFCAGVDVRDHLPDRGAEMLRAFHRICLALLQAPQPVIAAVHGPALGGGCELTMACDLVIASKAATFGQPEIKLGVFPPFALAALPRMIPGHLASELLLTGRIVDAVEAARIGLVNRVVVETELAPVVDETAAVLLGLSPSSLRLAKEAMTSTRARLSVADVEAAERHYIERLMNTPDAIEGLTAFLEKRAPRWTGVPA